MSNALDWSARISVANAREVVVCGGGPAGFAAGLAARRAGLDVLLVEGEGQLGGMGTSGLVSHWLGGRTVDGRWVVGGIFRELCEASAAEGIALIPENDPADAYTPHGWLKGLVHGIPFDPFGMARLLDEQAAAAGLDVLLHTRAVDVLRDGERITHVIIHNKTGFQAVPCRAVIDATGDADIAAFADCAHVIGREEDGAMTPVTLEAHVDNVDQDALSDFIHAHEAPRFRNEIQALKERGEWPFTTEIFISVQLNEKGTMMLNTTRLCGVDGTDGASITRGMQQGRQEIHQLLTVVRKHFPGFQNARLKAVAPLLGVRETRRIRGARRLTVEDVQSGEPFPDIIGFTSYGWDLPDPQRPSTQPMHGKSKPPVTPIPYGIMVPQSVENLICPGRAVSVERDVLGPLRVMAPCMAMGEAAGVATKSVAQEQATFGHVDTDSLRGALARQGAIVDWT